MPWKSGPAGSTKCWSSRLRANWIRRARVLLPQEMARIVQDGNSKILLNLRNLEFLSSAGLRVLLRTTKLLPEPEGRRMIGQAKGGVKEVLEISGFDDFIDVHDTEAVALEAF